MLTEWKENARHQSMLMKKGHGISGGFAPLDTIVIVNELNNGAMESRVL